MRFLSRLFSLALLSALFAQPAPAASPDLVITSISASPHIIAPNDPLTITGKVRNRGKGDAGYFRIGMFLSKDPVISISDIQIGSPKGVETESLAAGADDHFTYRTNLISLPAGIYYLGAIADYRNQITESKENNNAGAGERILIASSEPVAAGAGHSLALKSDGTLWSWGTNSHGQLGDHTTTERKTPIRIGRDTTWVAVAAGSNHSLALKSDGTLWAWGDNSHGQLGDGTTVNKTAPMRIGKDTTWGAIDAGDRHSLALKSDGTLWAWGDNSQGQLGDGTSEDRTTPVRIGKDAVWARITAGAYHTVALKKDMTLWAWGDNSHGQLGDGTVEDKNAPTRIGTNARWVGASAGDYHTVALNWCVDCWNTFQLWAWGDNEYGQLGDGTASDKSAPVMIGTDKDWFKVAAGSHHALALKKEGSLWAFGYNSKGQLGDGSTENKLSPVRIGTDNNWFSLSAGDMHSLTMKSDDTLWSWGGNSHGQLGDSTTANKTAPAQIKGPDSAQ